MRPRSSGRPWLGLSLLAAAAVCGVSGWLVGAAVLQRQIDRLGQQAHHRAEFYRLSLESLLSRNASLPRIMAREARLKTLLQHPQDERAREEANRYLLGVRDDADINAAFLLAADGLTLAASNFRQAGSYVGNNYAFRPYFLDAMQGELGVFYAIGVTTGDPGYFLASSIADGNAPIGAVVAKISLDDFESAMAQSGDKVFLVDASGVIFLSSLREWKYRSLDAFDTQSRQKIEASRQYREQPIVPLDNRLRLQKTPYLAELTLPGAKPQNLLVYSVPTGRLGWSIVLLTRTASERQNALLAGLAAGFAAAFLISLVIYFRLSARRHSERRQAAANLRQAIAERTADLRATNASLEECVEALKSTERILRETRDGAVQAGKLAVLGQMAAGVSHELNQPLTALHTLTDNAVDLLDRGHGTEVRENLGLIKQMAMRMGRIVGEIKNFTRKAPVAMQPVPIADVIVQAAMLVESRRRQIGARLTLPSSAENLSVKADSQRLEQVLVNILLNALDAVAHAENRLVEVSARRAGGSVHLFIRDHGTGITENAIARLFEPFFTTKSSGQGLGLGLAISRMIVEEFGGVIEARNHAAGGAEFRIVLEEA